MIKTIKKIQIIFLIILAPLFVKADNNIDVRNFVEDTIDRIVTIIQNNKISEDKKTHMLEKEFLSVVDAEWIAKFSMGRHWKELSAQQRTDFVALYKHYLVNIYVPNFKYYDSNEINVDSIQDIKSADSKEYLVKTIITSPNKNTTYSINYRIINKAGTFQIFDIITEGVSMATTQRAEFNAIIAAHGVPYLFEKIKKNEPDN